MQTKWPNSVAARLGFLGGKGTPFKSILEDPQVGARGVQSIRNASTRWHLPMNGNDDAEVETATLAVPIPPADFPILKTAAVARGLSVESFVADLVHIACSQRLLSAIMDDGRD